MRSITPHRHVAYVLFTGKGKNFRMCVSPERFHCRKGAVSEVPNFERLLEAFTDNSCKFHITHKG
jgi:hypothetical protein